MSKVIPFNSEGITVSRKDVKLVASSPNYLIAKLKLQQWSCIIVTARAPHSGRPELEHVTFWVQINSILQLKASYLPVLFCGDANAHLGEISTSSVGNHHSVAGNLAGKHFHEWLVRQEMFLPSTFAEYHCGTEFTAYVAPDGQHETRIDYIAVPQDIAYNHLQSWVCDDIDISVLRCDHRPVLCRSAFIHKTSKSKPQHQFRFQPDALDLTEKVQQDGYFKTNCTMMSRLRLGSSIHMKAQNG